MKMTPMLRQYLDLKEQAGSALLLYRMGDFYELFFEDAQQAAPILGITLTRRRQNDSVDAPMCGVPHHAFDGYLGKLLNPSFDNRFGKFTELDEFLLPCLGIVKG